MNKQDLKYNLKYILKHSLIILVTITIIIQFIFLMKINTTIKNFEQEIYEHSFFDYKYHDLYNETRNLGGRINVLENRESKEQWVMESHYSFVNLSEDHTIINTQFNVTCKELYVGSEVFIIAKNKLDETDFIKVKLDETSTLVYKGTLPLDINKNYSINVLSEGEVINRSYSIKDLNFEDIIGNDRFNIYQSGDGLTDSTFEFTLSNNNYNIDELQLTNITLRAYEGSTLLEEVDITNSYQERHQYLTAHYYDFKYNLPTYENQVTKIQIIVEDQLGSYIIEHNFDS